MKVAGLRVIKRFLHKQRDDRFWTIWIGTQFQGLASQTSGAIGFDEALNLTEEDLQALHDAWNDYKMSPEWEALYQVVHGATVGVSETTIHYKFNKSLQKNWNLIFGANWQLNNRFQIRADYGALKGQQQLIFMGIYRFGL